MVVATVVFILPQEAALAAYPECGLSDPAYPHHLWGHEWMGKNTYYGQFGDFDTNQVTIPGGRDYGFSLSHLYSAYPDVHTGHWVETGWYEGQGTEITDGVPHYYAAMADQNGGYHEHDYEAPAIGSVHSYETNDLGYDPQLNTYAWELFAGGHQRCGTTCLWRTDVPYARPVTGGEVLNGVYAGTQLRVHGTLQQLRTGDGVSHDWTASYPPLQGDHTYVCNDPNFTFTFVSQFQDYKVTGTGA
jgi:hypothetical protein